MIIFHEHGSLNFRECTNSFIKLYQVSMHIQFNIETARRNQRPPPAFNIERIIPTKEILNKRTTERLTQNNYFAMQDNQSYDL